MLLVLMLTLALTALVAPLVVVIRSDGRGARRRAQDWAQGTSLEIPRSTPVRASHATSDRMAS